MLRKFGEAITVTAADIQSTESVMSDPEIFNRFKKFASELKSIAPMAKDFLYFSAIMMHAAEAAILEDNGNIKLGSDGQPLKCGWEKKGESIKWWCSDSNIRPYKNANSDIFPESELIAAHKRWVGRPLCLDHKSSSVDMIRGVIVDTFYDHKNKRVIALCALDKVNYPDLARKVSTGYATSVSMGTAVGRAVCTDCGAVARVESDFCNHMKNKSCYGEVNLDLSPIELSIVVNGADPKAKIRHIVAAANNLSKYIETKETAINKMAENDMTDSLKEVKDELSAIMKKVKKIIDQADDLESDESDDEKNDSNDVQGDGAYGLTSSTNMNEGNPDERDATSAPGMGGPWSGDQAARMASNKNLAITINKMASNLERLQQQFNDLTQNLSDKEQQMTTNKRAYFQGGGGRNEPGFVYEKEDAETIRNTQDRQMVGQMDTGPVDGMHPGYDSFGKSEADLKKELQRAAGVKERAERREMALAAAKQNLLRLKSAQMAGNTVQDLITGLLATRNSDAQNLAESLKQDVSGKNYTDVLSSLRLAKQYLPNFNYEGVMNDLRNLMKTASNKTAYYQGGGDVNEPTPGKVKYQIDPLAMDAREEDKQMVGEKPFPGVGPVDGLYGDDMKTKQMLSRAGLKAKFIKAANPDGSDNLAQSRWQVYSGDKLILTASVQEISGGKVAALYDAIATKDFGSKIIETIKVAGFETAASMFKGAQAPAAPTKAEYDTEMSNRKAGKPRGEKFKDMDDTKLQEAAKTATAMRRFAQPAPAAAPGPAMPPDAGGAAPAPADAGAPAPMDMPGPEAGAKDEGAAGDPKARAKELAEKAKDLANDAVTNATDLIQAIELLTGEQPELAPVKEMGEAGAPPPPAPEEGKATTASLQSMRKTLNGALIQGMKEVVAQLRDVHEELSLVHHIYGTGKISRASVSDKKVATSLTFESFDNAKKVLADSHKLMAAFVKYARGTEALVKRASEERKFAKFAEEMDNSDMPETLGDLGIDPEHMDIGVAWDANDGMDQEYCMDADDEGMADDTMVDIGSDDDDDNAMMTPTGKKASRQSLMNSLKAVAESSVDSADLNTKAGRAAYRAKLAAKGMEFSDMLDKAHPKGGFTTELDVKPAGDLAHVEDLQEQHKAMMEVANAPPKVKKAAQDIQKLITSGKLAAEDVDGLTAFGVDAEAVKYWKSLYGEAKDGGNQFASELVKEYGEAKKKADMDNYQVKIARAYQLAYDMADRGMISREASSIREQVEEIMKYPDEGFESIKRTVAKYNPISSIKKEASIPQVGLLSSGDIIMPAAGSAPAEAVDFKTALEGAFSNRRY